MKRNVSQMGLNRTGIKTSPLRSGEALAAAAQARPSSPGDATALSRTRAEACREVDGVGSMPPPMGLKAVTRATLDLLKGGRAMVLLDKLGERAGFERTGVRMYELVLSKLEVFGSWEAGPSRAQLERIRLDELSHFTLLSRALQSLGGDPTALTPAADVAANLSSGVPRVLADPHVNLLQSLEGLLMIELMDTASWELLVALARELGHLEWAEEFQRALEVEQQHLVQVRGWLAAGLRREARIGQEAAGVQA